MIKTLSKRQRDVLLYISSPCSFRTADALAAHFSVSERTMRNDLSAVSSYLIGSGIHMEHQTRRGVRLEGSEEDLAAMREELRRNAPVSPDRSTRKAMETVLLLDEEPCSYEQLAKSCSVSRQTAISDIRTLKKELLSSGIEITGTSGQGLKTSGSEAARRSCMKSAVLSIEDKAVLEHLASLLSLGRHRNDAEQLLNRFESSLKVQYADRDQLVMMLAIALKRIRDGCLISAEKSSGCSRMAETKTNDLWKLVRKAGGSQQEAEYLYTFFTTARLAKIAESSAAGQDARSLADYLYDHLQELQPMDHANKERFLSGLTQHLQAALHRMKNGIHIENELQDQIMISIPLIYEFTKEQLSGWEKKSGLEFDSSETAYIAMYIASAYESSIQQKTALTVLLTCTFGITTSAILKSRIFTAIPECHVIGPLTMEDARKYLHRHKVDLIISTAAGFSSKDAPVIIVNPLLYQDDVDGIKNQIAQLSYSKMCDHFVNSYAKISATEKTQIRQASLHIRDLVPASNIQILDAAGSWEEAIQTAARPLLEKHLVEQRYVSRMITAVKQFGTYMCLVEDTAFVHAGTEDGITENCSAILVLKKPVTFGDRNPKRVRNIVIMGIREKTEDSFLKLVYIFANEENRRLLAGKNITVSQIEDMGE